MPFGRAKPQDQIDEWIAERVAGLSFVDVGGIGEWCTNERMSWARRCGAREVAVADIAPPDSQLWRHFHREVAAHGADGIREYAGIDVNDPASLSSIGTFDFVNCTGIIYHCPTPVQAIMNLAAITRRYLVVNTVIVPERIENERGVVTFPACSALFGPALSGEEREILRVHYAALRLDVDRFAPPLEEQADAALPFVRAGAATWLPYWWLFTAKAFESLVRLSGMTVLASGTWRNHTMRFLLEKA